MGDTIFTLRRWPRAILHIDGDAFFTSCEEAVHPELRGKPIITGGERGIGPATTDYLAKMRIKTASEFAQLPEQTIRERFTKPGQEIWRELRGESVYPVLPDEKSIYSSISKTKTFAPPTSDQDYLFAHLLRNLESACIKARRYGLAPQRIAAFLKKQNFDTEGREAKLNHPSAHPLELSGLFRDLFSEMFQRHELYRATGVVLMDLIQDTRTQYSLFEDPLKVEKIRKLYEGLDALSSKYGKHTLHLGSSHPLEIQGEGRRGTPTIREQTQQLYGETRRKHLGLPLFQTGITGK